MVHIEFIDTPSYFNTTELNGQELEVKNRSCNAQEARCLDLMVDGVHYTPFDVLKAYNALFAEVPITSIRRAITCLTKKGYLKKLSKEEKELKTEIFGSPNHYWEKL
jgi:Fe2+ or Zn2+ uptake regulation protein